MKTTIKITGWYLVLDDCGCKHIRKLRKGYKSADETLAGPFISQYAACFFLLTP